MCILVCILMYSAQVNLLYLGCRVLILLDKSYFGRFWTLFEAWLAMRRSSEEGLVETFAPAEAWRHYHIEVLDDDSTASRLPPDRPVSTS